jgi:O-antigen/teichoic acid export membrane protein
VGAVVALLLPILLVRHMTPAAYAVWVLVLQTAAYAGYLNFGLQTAIGRYVAYANEKGDIDQRDSVFSTALAGLWCAAIISLVCLAAAILAAPAIFPAVPSALVPQMRFALLLVGSSMALELPASACNGVFVGMERYEIPALTGGSARVISAGGVIIAVLAGRSLVVMAAIIASTNLLSYLTQYVALRRIVPSLRLQRALIRRSTARELSGYCFGLTVMSFAMLLITGLDLVLVGRFDFAAVVPYSVCATLVAFITGALGAVITVIMPRAAMLHAKEKSHEMGRLVVSATRLSVLILVLTGIPVVVYAGPILRFWIGAQYSAKGAPLLAILIIANIIRLIGLPYATVLVAAGQQNYIKVSPLSEGLANFAASVILGSLLGAIGVALGTLLGSFVSIATHLWYSMPRTKPSINFSRKELLISGVLTPLLWTCPLTTLAALSWRGFEIRPLVFVSAVLFSAVSAGLLIFRTQLVVRN